MRLRNFLIIIGLWVAIVSYLGFSIQAENVILAITGFVLIVSSFYVAAVEDKHRHKRIIQGEALEHTSNRIGSILKTIHKTKSQIFPQKPNQESKSSSVQIQKDKKQSSETKKNLPLDEQEDIFVIEEDDGRPRIRKAVSDFKIKDGSVDEIVD